MVLVIILNYLSDNRNFCCNHPERDVVNVTIEGGRRLNNVWYYSHNVQIITVIVILVTWILLIWINYFFRTFRWINLGILKDEEHLAIARRKGQFDLNLFHTKSIFHKTFNLFPNSRYLRLKCVLQIFKNILCILEEETFSICIKMVQYCNFRQIVAFFYVFI